MPRIMICAKAGECEYKDCQCAREHHRTDLCPTKCKIFGAKCIQVSASYIVKLSYFKTGGKWHSEGEYESEQEAIFQIWEEVTEMLLAGIWPGLVDGKYDYHVLIEVPGHPHDVPHLVVHGGRFR